MKYNDASEALNDYSYKRATYEDAERVAKVAVEIESVIKDYLMNPDYQGKLEDARDALLDHANKLATFCK